MKFEFPLNEKIRTMLRLESLFDRWSYASKQEHPWAQHAAILVLFEILEIAMRLDLRTELSKELDRQIQGLLHIRNNPHIDENALEALLQKMRQTAQELVLLFSKGMLITQDQEWLSMIKSRSSIPGGISKFDSPTYYLWQQKSLEERWNDLNKWITPLQPLRKAISMILDLLRQSGEMAPEEARRGIFQKMLSGKVFQLLEIETDHKNIFPEVSGNKYMITIRFHRFNQNKQTEPVLEDVSFKLSLCNF
jgi:cell division protein ZapD